MVPTSTVNTNPVEFLKAWLELPKPPTTQARNGIEIKNEWRLTNYLRDQLDLGNRFTITDVTREPTLNRIGVCFNTSSNLYTDEAARLDNTRDLLQISAGRPLIIEVLNDAYGSTIQMTPSTIEKVATAIFIIYDGQIYRADLTANINLLYAIYSEFYFVKFGGLSTVEGELRQPIPNSRLALFYKPSSFEELLRKYNAYKVHQ